jgi:hypothetical protein
MRVYRLSKIGHQLPTVLRRALVLHSHRLSAKREADPYAIKPAARHAGLPAKYRQVEEAACRLCFLQVSAAAKLEPGAQNEHAYEFEKLNGSHARLLLGCELLTSQSDHSQ